MDVWSLDDDLSVGGECQKRGSIEVREGVRTIMMGKLKVK